MYFNDYDLTISVVYENNKLINKDHVATPLFIVEQIFNLIDIKKYNCIWFPFDNYDSQFKLLADNLKLNYFNSHIFDPFGNDFFKIIPPYNCDLLISNPPFSLQNDILQRCFEFIDKGVIKSFCLLLPLSTLETPKRANLFEKYIDKLSIIIFKKRIKFVGKKTSFNTACCWVCYNIDNINKPINWI